MKSDAMLGDKVRWRQLVALPSASRPRFQMIDGNRMEVSVVDIILAGPLRFNGLPLELLRNQSDLDVTDVFYLGAADWRAYDDRVEGIP
jgi:hypothetical protein